MGKFDVQEVYRTTLIVDGSLDPHMDQNQVDRMLASGVTAVNWTLVGLLADFEAAVAKLVEGRRIVERFSDHLLLVQNVADIQRAKDEGKVGIIFGPQNARPAHVGDFAFEVMHALGVRILQLTYNDRNLFGDGAAEPADAGLSIRGKAAIEEMNRLGIVIDLSHCGDRTTLDAVAASSQPVLFTHANARALHPSRRNKTDEALKALAANGGVVGLSLWSPMLRYDRRPTVKDFVEHVKYVSDLIGCEHVGIGTDHNENADREEWTRNSSKGKGRYQSITGAMGDWYVFDTRCAEGGSSIVDLPHIAEELAAAGFDESELRGILGGNFLRVFSTAWGASQPSVASAPADDAGLTTPA